MKKQTMRKQIEIRLPQLGEGLREARIVELLCAAGATLWRGAPIYLMETDKSMVELESPVDGELVEWRVAPGDVVAINSVVAIACSDADGVELDAHAERLIPPRTRAYADQLGIAATLLDSIPTASNKLMPKDIDAILEYFRTGGHATRTVC